MFEESKEERKKKREIWFNKNSRFLTRDFVDEDLGFDKALKEQLRKQIEFQVSFSFFYDISPNNIKQKAAQLGGLNCLAPQSIHYTNQNCNRFNSLLLCIY